jgi:Uma2 family endonuclease
MTAATQPVTAEQLLMMRDDGLRYELVKGELKQMAPASHEHGRVTMNISGPLDHHVRTNKIGIVFAAETGFRLAAAPDTVRAPDVAFIGLRRYRQTGEMPGYWPGAPDLAIEVVSPGDSYAEVQEKVIEWLDGGASAVVVANPRKRVISVYRSLKDVVLLREGDILQLADIVPGFSLPVKAVFD